MLEFHFGFSWQHVQSAKQRVLKDLTKTASKMDEVRCEKEKSESNANCFGISSAIHEPKVSCLNNAEHTAIFMHALDHINAKKYDRRKEMEIFVFCEPLSATVGIKTGIADESRDVLLCYTFKTCSWSSQYNCRGLVMWNQDLHGLCAWVLTNCFAKSLFLFVWAWFFLHYKTQSDTSETQLQLVLTWELGSGAFSVWTYRYFQMAAHSLFDSNIKTTCLILPSGCKIV